MNQPPEHILELMRDHPMDGAAYRAVRVDVEAQPVKARSLGDFAELKGAQDALAAARVQAAKLNERAQFLIVDAAGKNVSGGPTGRPEIRF